MHPPEERERHERGREPEARRASAAAALAARSRSGRGGRRGRWGRGRADAEMQVDEHGVVVRVAVGRAGVDGLLRDGFALDVVVVVVGLVGVDVPRAGGDDARRETGVGQRVVEMAERAVEQIGITRGAFADLGEVGEAGVAERGDRILFRVGVEIADDEDVRIAAARGIRGEPLREGLRLAGADVVARALAVALIEVGIGHETVGGGGSGGRAGLRLEMVDRDGENFVVRALAEGLRERRAGDAGEIAVRERGGCADGRDGLRAEDEGDVDQVGAVVHARGVDGGVAPAGGCGGVEGDDELGERAGRAEAVVLDLGQTEDVGREAREAGDDLVELALVFGGSVGAARSGKSAAGPIAVEEIQHVAEDDALSNPVRLLPSM